MKPISLQTVNDADIRLRRALLRAARDGARLQDYIDWAELALASGSTGIARMFYGLIFLHMGFSPKALERQQAINRRTELWVPFPIRSGFFTQPPRRLGSPPSSSPGFSVDLAIAELRELMQKAPKLGSSLTAPAIVFTAPEEQRPSAFGVGRLSEICEDVDAALQQVPFLEAGDRLAQTLTTLAVATAELPPIKFEEHAGDSTTLAKLLAVCGIRKFLFSIDQLLQNSILSGALFQSAGQLDPGGLGPFFSNIRHVIRTARDIFALIDIASDGNATISAIQSWCVLFSGQLPTHDTLDLIDELGDRGMNWALAALAARIARAGRGQPEIEVLWRIRDAALDIGDFALGGEAQHLVALWSPTNRVEMEHPGRN